MKTLLLGLVLCVVMFVAGLVAPRRSRRLQRKVDRLLRRGESKGDRKAGMLGDAGKKSLKTVRHAGDKSAQAGRSVRERITP